MWCSHCQQDVPGVTSLQESDVRCPRCSHKLLRSQDPDGASPAESHSSFRPSPLSIVNRWELDDELHAADQLVRQVAPRRPANTAAPTAQRIDPPHFATSKVDRKKKRREPFFWRFVTSCVTWTLLCAGLGTAVFGGVLLGISMYTGRPELWQLGMVFACVGQVGLVIGLVMQLDGLGRSNRTTNRSLEELDQQLDELRNATSILSANQSGPAQSFYVHMAEGASPHLLLADLKGQLDLLATRMGEQERT